MTRKEWLLESGAFFDEDEDDDEGPEIASEHSVNRKLMLNMNDVWGWACSDGEYVTDEQLPEVSRLFKQYGRCGLYYWVSKQRGWCKSEFKDINRFVEFVRREEGQIEREPDSNKRAYMDLTP